jgi:hypothetical protein
MSVDQPCYRGQLLSWTLKFGAGLAREVTDDCMSHCTARLTTPVHFTTCRRSRQSHPACVDPDPDPAQALTTTTTTAATVPTKTTAQWRDRSAGTQMNECRTPVTDTADRKQLVASVSPTRQHAVPRFSCMPTNASYEQRAMS